MKFKMTPEKLMIALFAVVLLGIPIVTMALPNQDRSENENRTLAKLPTLINEKKAEKAARKAEKPKSPPVSPIQINMMLPQTTRPVIMAIISDR